MKWIYFNHKFDYESYFSDLAYPWAGHKYFAYDLIRNIKPKTIVELGTYRGTSFFSMCQGVKDANLSSKLYAIDSWKGEEQTGYYNNIVLDSVKLIKKKYFNKLSISLIKSSFDKAINQFSKNSIDLLHIDGLHTYEAVKHDFSSWLPKVKNTGIILFHDINEKSKGFGVYRLWNEIKKSYLTMEFEHSHGLGIIFLDKTCKTLATNQKELQSHYSIIFLNKLFAYTEKLKTQYNQLEAINNESLRQLHVIKSAKVYKAWQKYCDIRRKVLKS